MPPGRSRRANAVHSEFALIRRLRAQAAQPDPQVIKGIGDDTAVIKTSSTEWTLITTDLLAEGVHFDPATSSFRDIGYRAAIANLSDIAAMGGTPRFMLVSIAIPPTCSQAQIEQLYRGMTQAGAPYHVRLIGGDTSASKTGLFLNITLTGVVKPRQALLRSAARVGDLIYVTGTLGDSRAGLDLLTSRRRPKLRPIHTRFLLARHHRPSARIAEGLWLVKQGLAGAAIDLSDGLTGDLRHICEESGVNAIIDFDAVPVAAETSLVTDNIEDAFQFAIKGGEDFELLLTADPENEPELMKAAIECNLRLSPIGEIIARENDTAAPRIFVRRHGRITPIAATGYNHFRKV